MAAMGISFMTRGRPAWICGIVFGIIVALIGALTGPKIFLVVTGSGFFLFGLVMLIISYATGGASD